MGFWKITKKLFGIQAYEDRKLARVISEKAKLKYEEARRETRHRRKELNNKIQELSAVRLSSISNLIGTFIDWLRDMEQRNRAKEYEFLESIDIKIDKIREMETLRMNASNIMKSTAASTAAGAAALMGVPTAVTTVVGAWASASTGTAISTLSGVAATNATLAWLGGGSLAAGGGGMAAGAAVLSTLTVSVTGIAAVAVAGLIASAHFAKKLTAAVEYASRVDEAVGKMQKAWEFMQGMGTRVNELKDLTIDVSDRTKKEFKYFAPFVPDFDTEDRYQIEVFQRTGLLVKSIGELAKISIIDQETGELSTDYAIAIKNVRMVLLQ